MNKNKEIASEEANDSYLLGGIFGTVIIITVLIQSFFMYLPDIFIMPTVIITRILIVIIITSILCIIVFIPTTISYINLIRLKFNKDAEYRNSLKEYNKQYAQHDISTTIEAVCSILGTLVVIATLVVSIVRLNIDGGIKEHLAYTNNTIVLNHCETMKEKMVNGVIYNGDICTSAEYKIQGSYANTVNLVMEDIKKNIPYYKTMLTFESMSDKHDTAVINLINTNNDKSVDKVITFRNDNIGKLTIDSSKLYIVNNQ